jgi:hypothetical protein
MLQFGVLPSDMVPYPDVGVQAPRDYSLAVERNRIYLAKVALQGLEASAFGDAPNPSKGIVASGHNNVAFYLEATNARLVPNEDVPTHSCANIPNPECGVSRTRNSGVFVCHFEAANGGRMSAKSMQAKSVSMSESVGQPASHARNSFKEAREREREKILTLFSSPRHEPLDRSLHSPRYRPTEPWPRPP